MARVLKPPLWSVAWVMAMSPSRGWYGQIVCQWPGNFSLICTNCAFLEIITQLKTIRQFMPTPQHELDAVDRSLLHALQQDGRATVGELAERVALSHLALLAARAAAGGIRIDQRLPRPPDRHRAGWGVLGFVQLGLHNHTAEVTAAFEREVQALPQVLACHNLSGRYDYQLEVVAPSLEVLPNSCAPASAACRGCANFHQLFAQGSQAHGGAAGIGQRPKRRRRGGQALQPGQGCASSDGRISCALENSR
jgi:DNA-binding Lrp family transcriptional regulator